MQEKKSLLIKLPILDGSISSAKGKCGNKNCGCQSDKGKWHGPYFRWTGKLGEKRTTVTLTEDEAIECEKRIKNYRDLQKQIEDLVKNAQKNPPWK